ncbi:cytochrome c biogenesis protein ResB [Aquipuribacter nitratireducens]|uniref:Cytochrome c biogenesis protein ResB n=1 Tax=Aquipuribacter nitratireducens TaxID=650104 RepID=A0ABW0GRA5_9MICO
MSAPASPRPAPPEEPPAPPALGLLGSLRWLWRQLTSMRTALLLLLLLAVATVPGSLFPQRGVDAGAVAAYLADNPTSGRWLDRLGFFDVYASPWFAAVYLLLFVSLVGCIVPRARDLVRTWRRPPPRTPARLDRLPASGRVLVDADPPTVLARARGVLAADPLRARLGHVVAEREEADGARSLAAETGRLRETGNLLFHVSLIGVLVALATGSLYAYRGEALVVEGGSFSNVLPAYDSVTPGARFDASALPPFSFRLDRLDVAFEEEQVSELGAPRDFAASLTYRTGPSADPVPGRVRVNEPLEVAGTSIFLTGNGYAPVVEVRDGDGDVRWSGAVPFLPLDATYTSEGVVKAPVPGGDDIGLSGFLVPTAPAETDAGIRSLFPDARRPRLVLTAFTGDIGLGDGTAQSVYELDTTDMTQVQDASGAPAVLVLAPGDTVELPDGLGTVTFDGLPRFAAFQLRADPSGPLALVASLLATTGLVLSLFLPRRRVWVRVRPAEVSDDPSAGGGVPARTVVDVAALSRGRDAGQQPLVDRVLAAVRADVRADAATRSDTTGGRG